MSDHIGEKYIIEIERKEGDLYKAAGFNTLVFDDNGIERLTPIDDVIDKAIRGAETVQKKRSESLYKALAIMPVQTRYEIFGTSDLSAIIMRKSFEELEQMLTDYTKKAASRALVPGDICTVPKCESNPHEEFCITAVQNGQVDGVYKSGRVVKNLNEKDAAFANKHVSSMDLFLKGEIQK